MVGIMGTLQAPHARVHCGSSAWEISESDCRHTPCMNSSGGPDSGRTPCMNSSGESDPERTPCMNEVV